MIENNENDVVEREPFDIRDPSENRVDDDAHSAVEEVEEVVEPEAEAEPAKAEEEPKEIPAIDLGDLDQYIDTDLAKKVSALVGQLTAQIDDLKKSSVKPEPVSAGVDFFADHSELFGTDAPSPGQKKNRDSIREQMDILRAGYKAAGKKAPDARSLFDKALRSEFPEAVATNDRKQITSKIQNRERKMIPRPTSRHAESSDARARATEAVAKRMRELGY